MLSTLTIDGAGDDAGDGAFGLSSLQPSASAITLDSIMAFLVTLKTELDAVKAKTDLINTAVTVLIGDALPPVIVEIC